MPAPTGGFNRAAGTASALTSPVFPESPPVAGPAPTLRIQGRGLPPVSFPSAEKLKVSSAPESGTSASTGFPQDAAALCALSSLST